MPRTDAAGSTTPSRSRPATERGAPGATTEGWGRVVERGRGASRGRRLLRVIAAVLIVLLVGLPAFVSWRLPRQEVTGLAADGRPFHVLITGSDSRADLSTEERIALSTGSAGGERMDTILVLSVSGTRAGLLALPRDLLVERCDGSVGRINGATGIDGPGCLVTTVSGLTGLPIQHHLSLTFGGFRDVVDAVGGVRLCLDAPIADRSAGIDLPAGCQVLDGADALGFVRVRKIDNDLKRIERQQQFLKALARELLDPTLLLRPWRIVMIADGLSSAMVADEELGVVDLWRLALGLRALAAGDAVTATVPADPGTTSQGASVLRIRTGEAAALFDAWRDGSALRPAVG
jgi:LCP family protein required for cell wall assembly